MRYKTRRGGADSIMETAINSANEAALGTTKLVGNTVNRSLDIVNKGVDVGSSVAINTLDTLDVLQSTTAATTQQALQSSGILVNSALSAASTVGSSGLKNSAKVADALLETSATLAETSLQQGVTLANAGLTSTVSVGKTGLEQGARVANVGLEQGANVASTGLEQGANIAVALVEQSGKNATEAIDIAGNSLYVLLNTANTAVKNKTITTQSYNAGQESRKLDVVKRELIKAIQNMFFININNLITNLQQYVIVQSQSILISLSMFKSNQCAPGRLYGYTCSANVQQNIGIYEKELMRLKSYSESTLFKLKGLNNKVTGKLFYLNSTIVNDSNVYDVINAEANRLLVPEYATATEIFQEVLLSFGNLSQLIDVKIKEMALKSGGTRRKKYKYRV